uniref:Anti-mullerian hormone n=1 Tax=Lates calcarifer TaxID=8187 RepID=A0A0G2UMS2_LATCA|nr:anti-mullerian hormone [Lates calcarifer]
MLVVNLFYGGVLMLCWTWLCVALHVPHGQQLIQDHNPTVTVFHHSPHSALCYEDDIFTALHEGVGSGGELTNSSLTLFGVCAASDDSSASVLSELAKETSRNQRNGLEVLHPTGVLVAEENDSGILELTFDLPSSPLLELSPVLLLTFERQLKGGNLDVTFTSPSLQPHTQSVCISGETQHILLTGKASEANVCQKWRISAETKTPDMKKSLKGILIGEKSGSNISMTPLLLFSGRTGTETRHTHVSGLSLASSQTFSFLCELRRFLGDVLPKEHPKSPPLQLDSLKSMPPLSLGLSSSETLLAGLINSSSPTVFSFTRLSSTFPVHHGQLALPHELLEELRQRLEQIVMQIMGVIREEEVGHRAARRLERLRELSVLPKKGPAAGESQYRAFLLLKALQTVAHTYDLQNRLRASREGRNTPTRDYVCGLSSLTVSLKRHVVGPDTATINNCRGSCAFPLVNANNHAVLLNTHTESGTAEERAPCCVPVAYDPLEVVNLNEHGTYLSVKPDVVAKECGCR